ERVGRGGQGGGEGHVQQVRIRQLRFRGAAKSFATHSPRKRTSKPSIRGKVFDNASCLSAYEADAGLRRQTAIAKCKAMDRPDPYQERARRMARGARLRRDGRGA